MAFEEVVDQAIDMIKRRGQVLYRMLRRQFDLDDDYLDDLKYKLIEIQKRAADQDDRMLVWAGDTGTALSPPTSVPASAPTLH